MMDREASYAVDRSYIEPIKWCRYLVNAGYITVALIILAHVIWYFAARNLLVSSPDAYLWNYIVLPAIGLFAFTIFTDLFVRSPRFSLVSKEYISLTLFIIFSLYLSLTHNIASVLMASFILPIFVSTVFSNVKITRWIFWISSFSLFLIGVKIYFSGRLDINMFMQIFVVSFMFLCSYLLAKVLILYGHENLATMMLFEDKHQNVKEQLKLDPLTGVNNRRTFDDHLPRFMEECQNTQKFISLAMIDVDNFKVINDLCGHQAGDRVLLYLSHALKKINTENIHAFRMGGDEFSILFKGCDEEETYRICEDLRLHMESCPLRTTDDKRVTISCGAVCIKPNDVGLEIFMNAADLALYAAKNGGRNQVVIYNDLMVPMTLNHHGQEGQETVVS